MPGMLLMLSVGRDFGSHQHGGLVVSITLCHSCGLQMVSSVYVSISRGAYLLSSIYISCTLYYNVDDLSIHIIVHLPKVPKVEVPAKYQPASFYPPFFFPPSGEGPFM